ncbi:YoaK family protein [Granulicella sibirica]|uniref:Transmembrane protein n=1 Tax=Granulicella sibirica TaxID=2479048 RepID=A0A4V1L5G2_9BACT|nr:YoaK family protein [Granulicella sibirica]RXH55654.1 hypothetical protein GRAN_2511 [Granulicella sibirica]
MAEPETPLDTILGACLLASTGGMLDVIVYLNHGHVFACAMTGNVVLMGIAALQHDWLQVARHVSLLAAFSLGVFASMFLRSRHAIITSLTLEILALILAGALPADFSPVFFAAYIALFASLQSATFRHVNHSSYNSTFLTGNLRTAIEGAYLQIFPAAKGPTEVLTPAEKGRAQAHELGFVCLAFFLGALFGAWCAPRFANRSFWAVLPALVAALILTIRNQREASQQAA